MLFTLSNKNAAVFCRPLRNTRDNFQAPVPSGSCDNSQAPVPSGIDYICVLAMQVRAMLKAGTEWNGTNQGACHF